MFNRNVRTTTGSLAGLVLLLGLLAAPAQAFALRFDMPEPGKVTLAKVRAAGRWLGTYVVFQPADGGQCTFTKVANGREPVRQDVIINGTNSDDQYIEHEFRTDSNGRIFYQVFCNYEVLYASIGSDYDFEVNLRDGNDAAFIYNPSNHTVVRGGHGHDYLRWVGDSSRNHLGPQLYGGRGTDYLYTGWQMYGGAGNDVLCAPNPTDRAELAFGETGTDTYCGRAARSHSSIEHYRDSRCPAACQNFFGWPR